ncbi:T9SS type A sorting domain-containing protein [Candidatus Marinimicrobia bacterium]|nr:T9SS type A sorting domain-containing protein [Candidatus Neomarinimicrobiota bacterium]
MSYSKFFIGLIFIFKTLFSQSYNWPCEPFDDPHWINGTFCECRAGSSGNIDHFHDGVDIHLPEGSPVYSVINGTVTSMSTAQQSGINSYIRVGRFAYVHVNPNPALNLGNNIIAYETIIGWTNSWNHIHFKDGYPGDEINPIRVEGGLSPLIDNNNPETQWIKFYPNNSTAQFSNNRVYGLVDIVCKSTDQTDEGPIGNNNGIYKIGYEIFNSIGESVYGPHLPFEFDVIPVSDNYISNVYFPGSSTSTYLYIISNNLYSNSSLNVSNWDLGNYIAYVYSFDQYLNSDTTFINFEVVSQDTTPPEKPVLVSIFEEENGFIITWLPNSENDLEGYRLYYSIDMETWHNSHDELILTSEVTYFQAESFSGTTGFFRISAVDNASFPNESDLSDIFVFRHGQLNNSLLIIDSYSNQNGSNDFPYAGNLGILADNHEIGFSTINDTLFTLDSNFTIPINYLPIVITGNSANPIPDGLINQLNNVSFWILGSKSSESLTMSTTGSAFLQNYLDVEFTGSISVPAELLGIDIPYVSFSSSNLIMNNGIDSVNSIGGSLDESLAYPILADSTGIILGVGITDHPSLLSSIPLEILNENDRIIFFNRAMEFLIDTTLSIPADKLVPTKPTLSFYPNPFNSNGVFHINAEIGLYKIKLFNILGQLIWERNLSFTQSGDMAFSLPKNIQDVLTSGPYFIQIEKNGKRIASNKILFLK